VACLILNRTIGTGIFAQPTTILDLTGSSGVALLLWTVGGLITLSVALCWIEMGLTVPLHYIKHNGIRRKVACPRSGGDKNYLEYVYKKPDLLITCVFGIVFIVFGHLAGNALEFGRVVMIAIYPDRDVSPECHEDGKPCIDKIPVIGLAIAILTTCSFINVCTRQLAIRLNNVFAVAKVSFLVVICVLGIAWGTASGDGNMCRQISWEKKTPAGGQFGDIVLALLFATYPYSGFEQPFYVLAEVRRPHKTFPKAVILAMTLATVLFPLVNVSYLCVTPYTGDPQSSMILSLFTRISASNNASKNGNGDVEVGLDSTRAVSAILALSIFGNLMAQTFTATRVKQEIAKEGILPWSLEIATSSNTLLSKFFRRVPTGGYSPTLEHVDDHVEQVPMAATLLHWLVEVAFVLGIGIPFPHTTAYRLLTYFKVFGLVITLGAFTVWGLLYLKVDSWARGPKGRQWYRNVQWKPWLDPLHAVVASAALGFLLFATFAKPSDAEKQQPRWWVGPTSGWAITVGSVGWWLGLRFVQWRGRWRLRRERIPYVEVNEFGEAVQKAEVVECERIPVFWARQT